MGLVRPRPAPARRCSTGAAPRAARRWPASTASCCDRIAADPRLGDGGRGCRCPTRGQAAGRRPLRWSGGGDPPWLSADAVVVGGGLAGITAALRLADAGRAVTLLEARPAAGRRGVLVPARRAVRRQRPARVPALLRGLPLAARAPRRRPTRSRCSRTSTSRCCAPTAGAARLRRSPGVPAPLHLTAALARYRLLSPADRLRAARGALALRRLDPADPALDAQTLGDFLRRHGQNDATIAALWGIVATATLNLHPDEASLALAAKVFRTGLLDQRRRRGRRLRRGAARRRCTRRRRCAALEAAGVEVLLGHRVDAVSSRAASCGSRGRRATSARRRGRRRAGGAARATRSRVAALPRARPPRPARASARRRSSTCTSIYDRQVTDLPFAAAVDSPVQWFFDRTDSSGSARTHPARSTSRSRCPPPTTSSTRPAATVLERFVAELARCCRPAAARRGPRRVRHPRAPRHLPAGRRAARRCDREPHRASTACWLAGAWTATGWPDTMESAVRSGIAAAEAVLPRAASDGTTARFAA